MMMKLVEANHDNRSVKMVQSFISNRQANAQVGSSVSSEFAVARGVPQGSKIGPCLYSQYTLKESVWRSMQTIT